LFCTAQLIRRHVLPGGRSSARLTILLQKQQFCFSILKWAVTTRHSKR